MEITNNEMTLLSTLVITLLTVITVFGVKGLTMLSVALKKKTENEFLQSTIDNVSNMAKIVVESLNQTMVAEIRAAAEDGKLSDEEKAEIKQKALMSLLNSTNEQSKEILTKTFGNLEDFLSHLIESKVGEAKKTAW